jgi:hypothetical protein
MSLITSLEPDPISAMLGTGYFRFTGLFGISGLANPRPPRLDLLAVVSDQPGEGHFRDFVELAKLEYSTVCVWLVDNATLHAALMRYGFTPEVEIAFDGKPLKGLRWDKNK